MSADPRSYDHYAKKTRLPSNMPHLCLSISHQRGMFTVVVIMKYCQGNSSGNAQTYYRSCKDYGIQPRRAPLHRTHTVSDWISRIPQTFSWLLLPLLRGSHEQCVPWTNQLSVQQSSCSGYREPQEPLTLELFESCSRGKGALLLRELLELFHCLELLDGYNGGDLMMHEGPTSPRPSRTWWRMGCRSAYS